MLLRAVRAGPAPDGPGWRAGFDFTGFDWGKRPRLAAVAVVKFQRYFCRSVWRRREREREPPRPQPKRGADIEMPLSLSF